MWNFCFSPSVTSHSFYSQKKLLIFDVYKSGPFLTISMQFNFLHEHKYSLTRLLKISLRVFIPFFINFIIIVKTALNILEQSFVVHICILIWFILESGIFRLKSVAFSINIASCIPKGFPVEPSINHVWGGPMPSYPTW